MLNRFLSCWPGITWLCLWLCLGLPFHASAKPRWYDAQILYDWENDGHRIRALFYGSSDQFATVIEEPPEQNTLIRGNATAKLEWVGGQVEHTWDIDDKLQQSVIVFRYLDDKDVFQRVLKPY